MCAAAWPVPAHKAQLLLPFRPGVLPGRKGFLLLSSCQKPAVGHVHAESAKRRGDEDGQHRHGKDHLSAGQAQGEGDGTDGGLDGGFGGVGDHAEQPLPPGEGGAQHAEEYPRHAEEQGAQNDRDGGGTGGCGVAHVHSGAHQYEEEHLRRHPELGVLGGQPPGHVRSAAGGHAAGHDGQQAREGEAALQGTLQGHQQERDAEQDHHLGGIPQVEAAEKGGKGCPRSQPGQYAGHDGDGDLENGGGGEGPPGPDR